MFRDKFADYVNTDDKLSAAEHIDILTNFRIHSFSDLTDFQKNIVTIVHTRLTEFEKENSDLLGSLLTSYSINGVSMAFGDRVKCISGVVIPADLYSLLCSTGLCYPAI